MEASRWGGRTILLTVVAIVLTIAALRMAWFSVTVNTTYTVPSNWYPQSQTILFYDDHYDRGWGVNMPYDQVYRAKMAAFVDSVSVLVGWWVLAGIALIAATLVNVRSLSILAGLSALVFGFLTLVVFAVNIHNALPDFNYPGHVIGFWGTTSGTGTDGVRSWTWTMDWGPSYAFFVLFFALVLQTVAVSLRAYIALLDVRQEAPEDEGKGEQDSAETARTAVDTDLESRIRSI